MLESPELEGRSSSRRARSGEFLAHLDSAIFVLCSTAITKLLDLYSQVAGGGT